jgi:uncharacterized protein (DUF433 family)
VARALARYDPGMQRSQRIVIDAEVRFGKPCVRGTRVSVGDVLGLLASGMSMDELVAEYPSISRDDVLACLDFAARAIQPR